MRDRLNDLRILLVTLFAGGIAGAIALDFSRGWGSIVGVDFHTYLAAAVVGLGHGWSHIYDQGLVDSAQRQLNPQQWTQPFVSTPPVAWLVAPFTVLPYHVAYYSWGAITLAALVGAFAWTTRYRGVARWVAAAAAIVPWWVLHAVHVGQVAPLLAAAVLVAWRLLREERDIAAGLVLAVLVLKPNTALLVPLALLVTMRWRAFASWLGATAVIAGISVLTLGLHGINAYMGSLGSLSGEILRGASQLTLANLWGLSPAAAVVVRVALGSAAVAVMIRLRREPAMALAAAASGSLLVTSYLHGSDLCLFSAAGWIVWHERPQPAWRALLAGIWLLATPFLDGSMFAPALNRWVVCEVVVLAALVLEAWRRPLSRWTAQVLTTSAAPRRQAPA